MKLVLIDQCNARASPAELPWNLFVYPAEVKCKGRAEIDLTPPATSLLTRYEALRATSIAELSRFR